MREYTEPTPVDLQSFSTGRILKESWEICTGYFGALVMPATLIILACLPTVFIFPGKTGEAINNLLTGILSPIAMMGVHHSVIRLKAEGMVPSFSRTFSFGNDYWWRGIKIGFVLGFFMLALVLAAGLAAAIFFIPGMLVVDKEPAVGAILFVLAGILFLSIAAWFGSRSCLAYSAMADYRTSATQAFNVGWRLTKGNEGKTLLLGLIVTGLAIAVLIGFIFTGAILIGFEIMEEAVAVGVLLIPGLIAYMFGLVYTHVVFNLAYQALKPAPKEETPLPVT
jgi:hypothetical protein